MPKKKVTKKATTKKAAPAKKVATVKKVTLTKKATPTKKATVKKVAKSGATSVVVKGSVGVRLRMSPETRKQLQKIAEKNGVSQNTMINQLIKDAK